MTLYDLEGYLVDNPLDRYAIGARRVPTKNAAAISAVVVRMVSLHLFMNSPHFLCSIKLSF